MNAVLEAPELEVETDTPVGESSVVSACASEASAANHATGQSWLQAQPEIPNPAGALLLEEFDSLYETYQRRVYRQCYRMLGNHDDAQDLTQEVFLQLFRKAATFRGEASFSTWLHRLTINTVLMQMRRYRRWRGSIVSLDTPGAPDEGAGEVAAVVESLTATSVNPIDKMSLEAALDQLASGYREVFLLHDREGYRHDEIAKMLGINEGTSKSQLHKARLRLRNLVESGAGGEEDNSRASISGDRRRRRESAPEQCMVV